jgi:hypothetical protein
MRRLDRISGQPERWSVVSSVPGRQWRDSVTGPGCQSPSLPVSSSLQDTSLPGLPLAATGGPPPHCPGARACGSIRSCPALASLGLSKRQWSCLNLNPFTLLNWLNPSHCGTSVRLGHVI